MLPSISVVLDVRELGEIQAFNQDLASRVNAHTAATAPSNSSDDLMKQILAQLSEMQDKLTHLEKDIQDRFTNLEDAVEKARTDAKSDSDRVEKALTTAKKDIQRESKKEFDKVRTDIKKFSTTFGKWSVPSAQKYNRECHFGTGFQAVAFPDGTFPDEDASAKLSSLDGIAHLNEDDANVLARKYGMRRFGENTSRDYIRQAVGAPQA